MANHLLIPQLAAQFEAALAQFEWPERPDGLYAPIRYAMQMGGKRLRPAAVLMGCASYSDKVDNALPAALAVELFHNFTLLHDDVMDNAPLRRGQPTVWKKYHLNNAILSGDVMLVRCYQELMHGPPHLAPAMLDIFSRAATEVCKGQQLDMDFEQRSDVTIADYMAMIELKTAVLLGASLQMGALAGGATAQQAAQMYNFGKLTGIAFQLQDDILDVFGDVQKVGKQQAGDILSNKKTFLLLKAYELANATQQAELDRWISPADHNPTEKIAAVVTVYNQLNIQGLATAKMNEVYAGARTHLVQSGAKPEVRELIEGYFDQLLHREH